MQNLSYNTIDRFKKLLIIFWGLWWLIALWTDIVGGLAYIGWLTADWAPAKNVLILADSLKMYHAPNWLSAGLFIGILVWLAIIAAIFTLAISQMIAGKAYQNTTHWAFAASMALWLAFSLADQLIMNYDLEANHMIQASFQFLCWLSLWPNNARGSQPS